VSSQMQPTLGDAFQVDGKARPRTHPVVDARCEINVAFVRPPRSAFVPCPSCALAQANTVVDLTRQTTALLRASAVNRITPRHSWPTPSRTRSPLPTPRNASCESASATPSGIATPITPADLPPGPGHGQCHIHAPPTGAAHGAERLQKGADIGARKFAAQPSSMEFCVDC
jgi:hypothetical protein